jgi:hypothetical protein
MMVWSEEHKDYVGPQSYSTINSNKQDLDNNQVKHAWNISLFG